MFRYFTAEKCGPEGEFRARTEGWNSKSVSCLKCLRREKGEGPKEKKKTFHLCGCRRGMWTTRHPGGRRPGSSPPPSGLPGAFCCFFFLLFGTSSQSKTCVAVFAKREQHKTVECCCPPPAPSVPSYPVWRRGSRVVNGSAPQKPIHRNLFFVLRVRLKKSFLFVREKSKKRTHSLRSAAAQPHVYAFR